ncbi:hypothetical protein LWU70_20840 [Enterobacter hormaechei]|nr:hypothetical protein [Enterobacter hormaechei]
MSTITKEQLIEDLKASTQNSRGMFEIGEETICALMSLLTTPPAPVAVPDEVLARLEHEANHLTAWHHIDEHSCKVFRRDLLTLVNACRAAMLQGADGTLTNEGTIPVTQFKPVADLYGLTSPTGGETSFTFDAVEACDFIDGGWSCQEYVELGRFQEAVSGNSPAIPDGWVMVPEEPTHEMLEAGDEQFGTYDVYRRMIAASPQQK